MLAEIRNTIICCISQKIYSCNQLDGILIYDRTKPRVSRLYHENGDKNVIQHSVNYNCIALHIYKYEGWNFNFGNTPLDWIQELL